MIDFNFDDKCYGCSACESICPKSCIKMIQNERGFYIPSINEKDCINCNMCDRVCQVLHFQEEKLTLPQNIFASRSLDTDVLNKSSSGGVAYELSKKILEIHGVVYGAAFDKNNKVCHIRVESMDELYKLQGSKYVQSNLKNVFKLLLEDLKNNKEVLFIGTPCQVNGLKMYLRKDYENLLTCDLICHGTPSPKLLNSHFNCIEKDFNKKISNYNFRDKVYGWHYSKQSITFIDGSKKLNSYWNYCFNRIFFFNYGFKNTCYSCKYTSPKRVSDITLGDFWGIDPHEFPFNDDKGVNLVFINTNNGKCFVDNYLYKQVIMHDKKIQDALQYNLFFSSVKPKNNELFWNDYLENGYEYVANKYIGKRNYIIIRNTIKDYLESKNILSKLKKVIKR